MGRYYTRATEMGDGYAGNGYEGAVMNNPVFPAKFTELVWQFNVPYIPPQH